MTSTGIPLGLSWRTTTAAGWVPGVRPLEPFLAFNFAVEIEGLLVGGFHEVSGLESNVQVEEYQEGGVNSFVHKLPGATSHANIVLHHGLTAVSTLWNWYDDTTRGVIARRNATIMLLDPLQVPVMWWNVRRALPVRWSGPALNARSDEVAFEAIELVHEGLSKPLLGAAAATAHGDAQLAGR
jgi:phage tail-like protein